MSYIESALKQFAYYKQLGEKTIDQLQDEHLNWQYNEECNSIVTIVRHLYGNMLSRWTDFRTTDGEKEWRNRDAEFANQPCDRTALLQMWNDGWNCLFAALGQLTDDDLNTIIYIRNEGHTVMEAINRQLAHYPYHVGQMVFIGKMAAGNQWQSLSIPRGQSGSYNAEKFASEKTRRHFTDELLNKPSATNQ
jgi:hypothetical protein